MEKKEEKSTGSPDQPDSEVKGQASDGHEAESGNDGDQESGASAEGVGWLFNYFKQAMNLGSDGEKEKPDQLLPTVDFKGVAEFIKSERCSKIITMAGAGISTSAGIPDFRSPGSGLYDNLQKNDLPDPQAIFNIEFFREKPEPFFELAKELLPGEFKPTPCHHFIKMLHDKGVLLRHYTQNIDTLERLSGLPEEKIVEAHGTFHTSHCLECRAEYSLDWIKDKVQAGVPRCDKEDCTGIVKPDIVFFGEALPPRFFQCVQADLRECDLLIILGTSLVVQPFASLMDRVPDTTPRLYINREKPIANDPFMAILMGGGSGFKSGTAGNYRDVFWEGDCDAGAQALADLLGWGDDLKKMTSQTSAGKGASNTPSKGKPEKKQSHI